LIAAPLTKGSATSEGVNQPGRRQEDDVNIVVTPAGVAESHSRAADHGDAGVVSGPPQVVSPLAGPLGGGNDGIGRRSEDDPNLVTAVGVRRLTPIECERLQGFDDSWTQLGDTPDSRRYSALGDAVTVNVSEWIGRRLLDMARSADRVTA
jgi:site-specific DNA-cytosine methylase